MEEINLLYVSKGLVKPQGGSQIAARDLLFKGLVLNKNIKVYCLTNLNIKNMSDIMKIIDLRTFNNINNNVKKLIIIPEIKYWPFVTDIIEKKKYARIITDLLYKFDINLIHIHGYNTFYIVPRKEWDVPIVYTMHDFPFNWPNPINVFPIHYLEKIWYKSVTDNVKTVIKQYRRYKPGLYFHALSSQIREHLILKKGIKKEDTIVLYNGLENRGREDSINDQVNYMKKNNRAKSFLKVLVVGQITNRKNYHNLFNAFEDLVRQEKNIKLIILGKLIPLFGSFYFRKIWKELSPRTRKNIYWMGYITDKERVYDLYRSADLVVQPAYSEASSLVLSECLETETPLITTKAGSFGDLLNSNFTSINPNSVKSISNSITKFYKEIKKFQKKYQSRAKKLRILLDWKQIGKSLCNFYIKLL